MNKKEYDQGYQDAIDTLRNMKNQSGKNDQDGTITDWFPTSQPGQSPGSNMNNNIDNNGIPMQMPTLNDGDQPQDNSQADKRSRAEAAEASVSMGGFISQDAGSKIAKSEGYDDECEVASDSKLTENWKKATIDAVNKSRGTQLGNIIRTFKQIYFTSYDWKKEIRKIIGNALSHIDDETRWGKKKALAMSGEIKKFFRAGNHDMSSVIFCIDVSGSVNDDLLTRILSECYTIVKKNGIDEVTYVYYDVGIRSIETTTHIRTAGVSPDMVKHIKSARAAGKNATGGGGTMWAACRDQLDKMFKRGEIELTMVFTDGYDDHNSMTKPKCSNNNIFVIYDNPDFKPAENKSRYIKLDSKKLGA